MIEFFASKNIQTVIDGALGGLTFGIYSAVITQRQLEEFNKKMDLERKILYEKYNLVYKEDNNKNLSYYNIREKYEQQHKEDIKMLLERIEKLEAKYKARWW